MHHAMRTFCAAFTLLACLRAPPALAQSKEAAPPPALVLWAGAPTDPLPRELREALSGPGSMLLPQGPLFFAGQTLAMARRAFGEMRCSEALPHLEQAEAQLFSDTPVEDARPLLRETFSLLIMCADRVGDDARANRAADRLLMIGGDLPPDVQLVLRRYRSGPLFGPPPPPVYVETDPPGAQVIRNLLAVGKAPIEVAGGNPDVDLLDVEMGGFRKLHRPLASGEKLGLGLRAEDRLPVLGDAVALLPLGSDEQARALDRLGRQAADERLRGRRVIVVAPLTRGGAAVPGERLRARVYDLGARRWLTPIVDVAAGPPRAQAEQVRAIFALRLPSALPAQAGKPAEKKPAAEKRSVFFRLPFTKTKWYTWVVAGGVAALIAGLLIAERFGDNTVTVQASR